MLKRHKSVLVLIRPGATKMRVRFSKIHWAETKGLDVSLLNHVIPSPHFTAMIGPDIPAHLRNSNSSPTQEEKDALGPHIPEESAHVGPQLPVDLSERKKQEEEHEIDDDEDDYTPALPPELVAHGTGAKPKPYSQAGLITTSNPSPEPSRRILGPSLPSHSSYSNLDEDSDEDDVGPKPLPEGLRPMHEKDAVAEFMEREERRRKNEELAKKPKALKREEWMLVPPSAGDLLGSTYLVYSLQYFCSTYQYSCKIDLDTTKLKARQFSKSSGPLNKRDNTLWTETPAERQQRIADEVAGKKRRAVDVANEEALGIGTSDRKRSKREEESIRRGVDEYTVGFSSLRFQTTIDSLSYLLKQKLRGPSLVEQHSSKHKAGDEDDESEKAIWDHSRDMSIGGRLMDGDKRNQMIREAKGLGERFGSGKGGSFL